MSRNRQADADLQAFAAQIQEERGCTIAETLQAAQRERVTLNVFARRYELERPKGPSDDRQPTRKRA